MKSSSKFDPDYNLAFDNPTLCNKPVSKPSSSVDYSLTKENLGPCNDGSSPGARKASKLRPPLQSNSVTGNQPESRTDNFPLFGVVSTSSSSATSLTSQQPCFDDFAGFGNIDSEIESIMKEISRLSTRLEFLRLEKMKRITVKSAAALKRGRFVPAKFMDPPLPPPINPRKIEESMKTPLKRKGISLGPGEIYSATKSNKSVKRQEITPVHRSQSRRKSCSWKLQEVDELGVIDERGKSVSLSLKSQKTVRNLQADSCKQAVITPRASKNTSVEKEDELSPSIQPKELFKDGDKSMAAKNKSLRCGSRVVASRYKSSNGNGDSVAPKGDRKRSLHGNDNTFSRKRISLSRA